MLLHQQFWENWWSEELNGEPVKQAPQIIKSIETESNSANGAESTSEEASGSIDILPGFPQSIEGELILCNADNINTDGIYPGKYTYQDDITKEQMAKVCMENYDSQFYSKPNQVTL